MTERADRLSGLVTEADLDSLLVAELTNLRYVSGFTGTNGACLIGPDIRTFFTDFRYAERAADEVNGFEVEIVSGDWLAGLAAFFKGKVGIEDDHLTVRTASKLEDAADDAAELIHSGGFVESLRRVKEPGEIEKIATAAELTDSLYHEVMERGLINRSEAETAAFVVARMREQGAEPSFPPIVASGPNGASPHAEPSGRVIAKSELVTIDMGATIDGYCSDCTRTFATGMLDAKAAEIYEVTLAANEAGLDAVEPGAVAADVDAAARDLIKDAGFGEYFGHGLGHGVGLEVHEGPRLGARSKDVLAENEVVTVEPGIYISKFTGVRIEDLVVVGKQGISQNMSTVSKALTYID